jgi:anti-anti-sigma regulatory factor
LLDAVALEAKASEISKSGAKYISIDLSSLDYIYSDSINKFIGINRSFISIFGRLALVAPHQKVFEILCRAGADKQMKIVRSFEELQTLSDILAGNPADVETPKFVQEKPKSVDDFSDLKQILSDTLKIDDDLSAQNDILPRFSENPVNPKEKLDEDFNENKITAEPKLPEFEQISVETPKKQETGFVPSEDIVFDVTIHAPEKQMSSASDALSDTVAEKPKKFITVGQNPPPDLDLYYYEEPSDEAKEILYRRNRKRRRKNKLPKLIFFFILIVSAAFAALVFTEQISIEEVISMFVEQSQEEVEPEIIEPEFKEEPRFESPAQPEPPMPVETKRVSTPAQKSSQKQAANTQKSTSNSQKTQNKPAQATNKPAQTAVSDLIEIYTFPAGASVFVNGANYGKTPANIQNLPYGNVSIRVESPDFEPYVWNIKYDGGNTKLTKNLDKKIEVRGQSVQPARQSAAPQTKQQAQTQTQPSVQKQQTQPEQVAEVKPVEAIISFSSSPPGAEIFENGVFVGKANGTPFKTTTGEHTYEFRKDDRSGTWTGRLRDGKNQSQLVRLE